MPPTAPTQQFHHHRLESGFVPRSPTSSPIHRPTPSQRTMSQQESEAIRKRVCKACDRCRLKKSKCDGSSPCSRCKADNAICVFGERKKTHDKVYPKGYVEMLEQQQGQLVDGLREMYRRLRAANAWSVPALSETTGHPLTHDMLAALNLLESKTDGSGEYEHFEEDCSKLQSKLLADGAGFARRRASCSSESEHSQHEHPSDSRNPSQTSVPSLSYTNSPSPLSHSPQPAEHEAQALAYAQALQHAQQQQQLRAMQQRQQQQDSRRPVMTSPPQTESPVLNDLPVFQTEWAFHSGDDSMAKMMRSKYAMQTPLLQDGCPINTLYDESQFEEAMALDAFDSTDMSSMMTYDGDFSFDPMDLELNKYVAA